MKGDESMGELRILERVGDMKISWNSSNREEIKTAKEIFDKKISQGWSAFGEKLSGAKGDRIKEFDSEAERIVLVPPITGG